jgi:hypothetical protein
MTCESWELSVDLAYHFTVRTSGNLQQFWALASAADKPTVILPAQRILHQELVTQLQQFYFAKYGNKPVAIHLTWQLADVAYTYLTEQQQKVQAKWITDINNCPTARYSHYIPVQDSMNYTNCLPIEPETLKKKPGLLISAHLLEMASKLSLKARN